MQLSIKVGACPSLLISTAPLPRFAGWNWSPHGARHKAGHSQHTQNILADWQIFPRPDYKEHSLTWSTRGDPCSRTPWGAQGGSRGKPLPASELLPCLEALTSTTCPTLDLRSHPSSLGVSSYLENSTGILASPRSWPSIDLLLTHPVPGSLT